MIKRIMTFALAFLLVASFAGIAVGSGERIRTYSMGIYDTGTGTTVGAAGEITADSGGSKYFTWRADGAKAATADNRTFDLNDSNPNWRAISWRTLISSVTDISISGNTFYVVIESCMELSDTDCNWVTSQRPTSGVSESEIYGEVLHGNGSDLAVQAFAGTSLYGRDITSLMSPAARYYRFKFMSGSSQYPGSPTGTSWDNDRGPKAWLVITSY